MHMSVVEVYTIMRCINSYFTLHYNTLRYITRVIEYNFYVSRLMQ